jgi:predicted DNA binding CopG/RHH family protein
MKNKMILTPEEIEIEDSIARGEWSNGSKEDMQFFIDAAKNTDTSTKDRINIRLSPADLVKIRGIADSKGLPYQTLICSVLHQYATDQLVGVDTVMSLKRLLKSG